MQLVPELVLGDVRSDDMGCCLGCHRWLRSGECADEAVVDGGMVGWLVLLARSTAAHRARQPIPDQPTMRTRRRTMLGGPLLNQYQPTA